MLLFCIILFICNITVFAVVSPTSAFYVNDYARLLSNETENYIINTNKSLYNQTGAQIVVVTIPSLEGSSIEEYATQLFRNFGIGNSTKNNGILMLLALEEREFRIEVGYGLEGCLPDGKTGRIQDEYIIPYLKQNNWDEGIKNGYNAIIQEVANEYGVDVNADSPIVVDNSESIGAIIIPIFIIVIILIVIIKKDGVVYYGGSYSGYSRGGSSRSGGSSFGGGRSSGGGSSGGGGSSRRF